MTLALKKYAFYNGMAICPTGCKAGCSNDPTVKLRARNHLHGRFDRSRGLTWIDEVTRCRLDCWRPASERVVNPALPASELHIGKVDNPPGLFARGPLRNDQLLTAAAQRSESQCPDRFDPRPIR